MRRALINAILERTPTGPGRGQRSVRKARKADEQLGVKVAADGASAEVCHALGIPFGSRGFGHALMLPRFLIQAQMHENRIPLIVF
ncbi:MAG: hypothetical protein FJ403_10250 [Verrucomicrobia bacterium]|nr:hypothetical protein [Verrucomicrobiota bacterium]